MIKIDYDLLLPKYEEIKNLKENLQEKCNILESENKSLNSRVIKIFAVNFVRAKNQELINENRALLEKINKLNIEKEEINSLKDRIKLLENEIIKKN